MVPWQLARTIAPPIPSTIHQNRARPNTTAARPFRCILTAFLADGRVNIRIVTQENESPQPSPFVTKHEKFGARAYVYGTAHLAAGRYAGCYATIIMKASADELVS
jgi:hypothetical protein